MSSTVSCQRSHAAVSSQGLLHIIAARVRCTMRCTAALPFERKSTRFRAHRVVDWGILGERPQECGPDRNLLVVVHIYFARSPGTLVIMTVYLQVLQ